MSANKSDASQPLHEHLESFYERLQENVIRLASRLINHDLYTKAVLSTLPIAVIAVDKDGTLRTANKSAEEILGASINPAEEATFDTLFAPYPELTGKIRASLEMGEQAQLASQTLVSPSGDENVVNIYIQPLYDEEQSVCGTLLALEDQTYITFLRDAFKRYMPSADPAPLIAESPAMRSVADQLGALGTGNAPILLTGAPGSGRTFVSAKIHEGLERSKALLICLSEHSATSIWRQLETQTFLWRNRSNKKKAVCVLRLDDVVITAPWKAFELIDWRPARRAQGYAKVLAACRG